MSYPTTASATSAGFGNHNQQQPQNAYTTSQMNVNQCFNNTQGYTQGIQFHMHPSAFGMPQQKNNAYNNSLGLTGPYNFTVPQRALPFPVKAEASTPALSYRAPSQQSSNLVARTRQYANYARVEPYMYARMMRWPAMPPQSNMAPPPYSMNPPLRPMSVQDSQSFAPHMSSAGPMLAPKPVRSWHIEALQSLSALTDAGTELGQSKPNAVKVEEQDKANSILPAELDVNNGIYRAYRADTGQRHILLNHTVESALSPSDRAELAAMRKMVSRGEQPTTCRLSGCDHVASCTRYLVKHVHAHLRIRWQCEFCERSFGARADMLTEHVKKAHPEMLTVFKIRRMHRKAPVMDEPI